MQDIVFRQKLLFFDIFYILGYLIWPGIGLKLVEYCPFLLDKQYMAGHRDMIDTGGNLPYQPSKATGSVIIIS